MSYVMPYKYRNASDLVQQYTVEKYIITKRLKQTLLFLIEWIKNQK